MSFTPNPNRDRLKRSFAWLPTLTLLVFLLAGHEASTQTLQLRYTFEDSGTTTTSDPGGALSVPLTLLNFSGAATDLHGGANSGVQNQGKSLDLSAAVNATGPNINGPIAQATNNATLGTLGVVSNFTLCLWIKQDSIITNTANIGGRLFMMGTNGVVDQTSATTNDITAWFQTTNALHFKINSSIAAEPLYFNPLPTNVWLFVAMVYDGTNNVRLYYGTEASPAKLVSIRSIGAQTVDFGSGGGSGSVMLGNRSSNRQRAFDGWMDEFRFYTGDGDATFIENQRQASTPVVISGLYPDGMNLIQGTNTLSFTASSVSGISTNNIKVAVNGTDVSSSLVFGGTSTSRTVSYASLPVNPTLVANSPLNAVRINLQVTDDGGIITSNIITYDAFSPTNFTFEAEDYDYADDVFLGPAGLFIDNPRYAFESAVDTYWQRQGQPAVDYSDNTGPQTDVYRGPLDLPATEFSVGTGANGGPAVGELMRQKVLNAFALDSRIRDVDLGFFDANNWMNYTRTLPTGAFNVYIRMAYGGGATANSTLEEVTSGQGTPTQTTNTLGSFSTPNSGGWQSYTWVPLRDSAGNLVRLDVGGLKTLRLSARTGGGGNVNFLMLTLANTNLPVITGVYPNGTNMFQPYPTFSFNVSSPAGVAISTNSIRVSLTIRTVLSTVTTNITSTNGLTITGTASSRNVSLSLITNATYTAVINVTDANGSPASSTVNFDTYNPLFVWEAEDYDYGSGLYIDNPPTAGYSGQIGTAEVDYHDNVAVSQNGTPVYRTSDPVGLEINGDAPLRTQFIGTGFADYDVGWYDNGNWNNYTRTFPSGQYNVYLRVANGSGGNGGITLSRVTSGAGTPTQATTNLGTMTIPATGGWQTYTWVPLRDTGGNLVKFAGGGVQTLRATSSGGANANFYALFPANTNLPIITSVYPDGTGMFQATNRLSFAVTSSAGVNSASIIVVLDGTTLSNLTFSGSTTAWNVSYTNLTLRTTHNAVISAVDINGNSASTTVNFDTFSASYFTWEAEDYDHDGGLFFDNPQVDAYTNLAAVVDVDFHDQNTGGTLLYRPSGTATEITADLPRTQFAGAFDYNIGFFGQNEWGNYTRHYPAGSYNVWGRFACGDANGSRAMLSSVTSGWGTTTQTTNFLGSFAIPTTGWSAFGWVPMRDDNGNMVSVTLDGNTNTLKLVRDGTAPFADVNVNFLMLVPALGPVTLTATLAGVNVNISFPTQSGYTYQIERKDNLTDPTWTSVGSAVTGDGTVKIVPDLLGSNARRFYRARIQ